MKKNNFLLSALSVGVGVGVGLGLAASGQTVCRWTGANGVTAEQIEQELMNQLLDARDTKIKFAEFPYYISVKTFTLLASAAYVHIGAYFHPKHCDVSKHTRNLSPTNRAILLSGPAELYHQMLAKALAHEFYSKLLLLDISDFLLKMQSKYGFTKREPSFKRSSLSGYFSMLPSGEEIRVVEENWCFDEEHFLEALYKVLVSTSKTGSIILYVKDVEKVLLQSQRLYNLFQKLLRKVSGSILILGSRMLDPKDDCREVDKRVGTLFPYNIEIQPPEDETDLVSWKALLEKDMKMLQFQDNKNHIAQVLASNDLECDDLDSICHSDAMVLRNYIKEIVATAICSHLRDKKDPEYRNGKLVIPAESLSMALEVFQDGNLSLRLCTPVGGDCERKDTIKPETNADTGKKIPPDNEFEQRLRSEVIPANKIGVTFEDIGAMDEIKESLQELVMLPLRRPDLFKGGLLRPCKGILLFGPPGTGKTMLAKAIATEAGASFINISMSTLSSTVYGEEQKLVRALFTLAAKLAPTIIFVDEVDSLLGQRTATSGEYVRRGKNEFMTHWDGLLTKKGEQVLVLAATNRPFDLDEAIIRRFERRIMVGLPSVESRERILKTLMSKEKTDNIDFKELASMTEGYSGSDLKNLCVTAAYRPLRELIQQELSKEKEKKKKVEEGTSSEGASDTKDENKEERLIKLIRQELSKERKKKAEEGTSSEGASDTKDENKEDCLIKLIRQEVSKKLEKEKEAEKGTSSEGASDTKDKNKEECMTTLRPLNMEDMKQAKNQIAASLSSEGLVMHELKQWNDLHGEGGSRKEQQQQLTYFI